jgi:hypothetical protein
MARLRNSSISPAPEATARGAPPSARRLPRVTGWPRARPGRPSFSPSAARRAAVAGAVSRETPVGRTSPGRGSSTRRGAGGRTRRPAPRWAGCTSRAWERRRTRSAPSTISSGPATRRPPTTTPRAAFRWPGCTTRGPAGRRIGRRPSASTGRPAACSGRRRPRRATCWRRPSRAATE